MKLLLTLALSATLAAPAFAQDRVEELERRIEVLAQELEQLKLGAAADTARYQPRFGLAPAASKVYGLARGISIGGYGEMLYENFDREREDEAPSAALDRLDYLRHVVYLGYKFSDELLLNTEIEIEHAGVRDEASVEGEADPTGEVQGTAELTGEVVLEFAYLEWARRPSFGLRAGLLLMPVGLVNELHEPPVFLGARRPEVEQRVLPTTWRANGAGVFGELGGLSYRAYVTEGLDAESFGANGIRDARQSGSRSLLTQPAFSARVDWSGLPALVIGASAFTGDSWQGFQPLGPEISPRLTLADVHARLEWQGLRARGLYARGWLDEAAELSDVLGLSGAGRLGGSFFGTYAEAAYDVLQRFVPGSRYALAPYLRWELYDTQEEVEGGVEDPELERTVVTAGVELRPHPNVVLKADRQWKSNQAETGISQWNLALGYLF